MAKSIFIDTTRCTACRGCQVACKQWQGHEAVPTKQTGTHQNPPDLTPHNYKLVRFSEHKLEDRVHWLFFPEQCRHCLQPACKAASDSYVEGAIVVDEATGIVVCTEKTKELTECTMCIDRVQAGLIPMCVKTCCTGTMNFGERADMLKLAEERLAKVQKEFPKAELLDAGDLAVIYLVSQPREMYHKYAQRELRPLNRADFLAGLTRPLRNILG